MLFPIRKGVPAASEALESDAVSGLCSMAELKSRDIFDEVYKKHFKSIFLCAFSILGDAEDSRDITQEAFENFYRKNQKFPTTADAKYHLLHSVRNLSLNLLKRKKTEKRKKPLISNGQQQDYVVEAEQLFSFDETMRIVDDALFGKEDLKDIFCMKVFCDLTCCDIAVMRGMPLNSVKSKLYRARILVRERIEEIRNKK